MALKVGELFATLNLDDSGFGRALDGAKRTLDHSAAEFAKSGAALSAALTLPVVKIGREIVGAGSDFEKTMSNVEAISGATAEEMGRLKTLAQEMGASTKFSATESAEALSYMAMAGWDTEKMISGLPGIIDLAAASGEDLADVSDIVTDALTAFGMGADQSGHFADVLAAASANANTNVGMMGASFKYVAAMAGTLGYSAEDAAVALGLMANAGIKGEMAGTQLRNVISNLSAPTSEVQKAMKQLGISVTDSGGKMLPLMDVMRSLRTSFSALSEQEQAAYAEMIGGKEAMAGLLSMVNASEKDFNALTQAIYSSEGAAARMSDTMMDNLQGDMTLLRSALEGVQIGLYGLAQGGLRSLVQAATGMVNWFGRLSDSTKSTIMRIAAFAASLGPAKLAIAGVLKGLSGLMSVLKFVISPLGLLTGGFALLYKNSKLVQKAFGRIKTAFKSFISALGRGFSPVESMILALTDGFGMKTAQKVIGSFRAIRDAFGEITDAFKAGWSEGGFFAGMNGAVSALRSNLSRIDLSGLWDGIRNGAGTIGARIREAFARAKINVSEFLSGVNWASLWSGISGTYESLRGKVGELLGRLPEIIGGFISDAANWVQNGQFAEIGGQIVGFLAKGIESKAGGGAARLLGAIQSLFSPENMAGLGDVLSGLGDLLIDGLTAAISAAADGAGALIGVIGDLLAGAFSEENTGAVIGFGQTVVDVLVKGIQASISGGTKILTAIGDAIRGIDWANAGDMLSGLGGSLIQGLCEAISGSDLSGFMIALGDGLGSAVDGIRQAAFQIVGNIVAALFDPDTYIMLWNAGRDLLKGLLDGILAFMARLLDFSWLTDWASELGRKIKASLAKSDLGRKLLDFLNIEYEHIAEAAASDVPTMDMEVRIQAMMETEGISREEALKKMKEAFAENYGGEPIEMGFTLESIAQDVNFDYEEPDVPEDYGRKVMEKVQEQLDEAGPAEARAEVTSIQAAELGKDAVKEFGEAGTEAGMTMATNMGEAITANTAGITGAIEALKTTLNTHMDGLKSQFTLSGQNFTLGLAQGIRMRKSAVVSAAREVGAAARSALQGVLAIHSPSRALEDDGENFDAGFARGILGNAAAAGRAAASMAKLARDSAAIGNPNSGFSRRISAAASTEKAGSIDYDALAEAMDRRQQVLVLDGKTVARIQAENASRAENARNRRLALGYGF